MSRDLDHLLDVIYGSGADPDRWPDALTAVAEALNGHSAALHVGDTDCSGFSFGTNYNFDPDALAEYAKYYFAINPLNPPLTRVKSGTVVGHHELVPLKEFERSEFYNEFSRRYDITGSATGVIAKSDNQIACIGVTRGHRSGPFSETELALLRRLLPHIERAVDLNRQLAAVRAERDQANAALNLLDTAVIFLDVEGAVIRTNAAGEILLQNGDSLRIRRGRLSSISISTDSSLSALIHRAIRSVERSGGTLALPRASGQRALMMRVIPYNDERDCLDTPEVAAIAFIRDPKSQPRQRIEEVAAAYGLTIAEGRLVGALVSGMNLKEAADAHGITLITARNHLARAMSKTDTNRQAELVRVILESRVPVR